MTKVTVTARLLNYDGAATAHTLKDVIATLYDTAASVASGVTSSQNAATRSSPCSTIWNDQCFHANWRGWVFFLEGRWTMQ